MDITIKILPSDPKSTPKSKLADAELMFGAQCGILAGLKLIGFTVWERTGGGRTVTFPARQYSVNGDRRSFALLRPVTDYAANDGIREAIIDAYTVYEMAGANNEPMTVSV